jgi:hypothetical protein
MQYCVEISNKLEALENINAEVDVNSTWETVRENLKISLKESPCYYELKHKLWFGVGSTELLDEMKQATLQWLQKPSELDGVNLNSVRHEVNRHFWNKKRDYLKELMSSQ